MICIWHHDLNLCKLIFALHVKGTITKVDSASSPITGSRESFPDSANLSMILPATKDSLSFGQPKTQIKLARPGSQFQSSIKDRRDPANNTLHNVPASPSDQGRIWYFCNPSSLCSNKFLLNFVAINSTSKRYSVFNSPIHVLLSFTKSSVQLPNPYPSLWKHPVTF